MWTSRLEILSASNSGAFSANINKCLQSAQPLSFAVALAHVMDWKPRSGRERGRNFGEKVFRGELVLPVRNSENDGDRNRYVKLLRRCPL